MEADFSGYATKSGLKCSDGRTIMPGAFKHQDKVKVPLVWQHGHNNPENVLGHAILENRDDGVYAYGFFNTSARASHAHSLIEHGDINMLSIWANELIEKAGRVLHGAIREVSLVLSGANPGALIEKVTIRHSDGDEIELDDEVIIYTGLELEHTKLEEEEEPASDPEKELTHAEGDDEDKNDDESIEDVYETMTDKQKKVLHYMVGEALTAAEEESDSAKHSDLEFEDDVVQEIYDGMSDEQKAVIEHMVSDAIETTTEQLNKEGSPMTRNVFEKSEPAAHSLSHSDIQGIVADATKAGSLKDAVENYALAHGIESIDSLFPEPEAINNVPEFLARRTEWVSKVFGGARKSPFSRIKTLHADITMEEARAKGYVTGALKKEEFFSVMKRVTQPTTIYKKQKLDRDDMVDITDFDVVSWLKSEMRLMLDEEVARAILIGDGRDISHEDKVNEGNIRPIATDHELYTTTVNVNIADAASSVQEIIDAIIMNRRHFKGSAMPTMFTSEIYISRFLLLKDSLGRRIYKNLDELATELRVKEIVPVEIMEENPDTIAVLYNPADYVVGAASGGNISMFDDFDIDYNQHKYLIETRMCGALTKLKSALVVMAVEASLVEVVPAEPGFDGSNVTITDQTGVVYTHVESSTVIAAVGNPHAVATGVTFTVEATPAAGYYFPTSEDDTWVYVGE